MKTILIDADSLCFTNPDDTYEVAIEKLEWKINKIKSKFTDYNNIIFYLTMGKTFRNDLLPEYKANRKDRIVVPNIYKLKKYLIDNYNAIYLDGMEADDLIGDKYRESPDDYYLCSIDKDLLYNLEGKHLNLFNYEFVQTNGLDAHNHFYKQMIKGDKIDNIPDLLSGFGPVKLDKLCNECNISIKDLAIYICNMKGIDYTTRYRLLYMGESENIKIELGEIKKNKKLERIIETKKFPKKYNNNIIRPYTSQSLAPGRHKDKTWLEVKKQDIGYIQWMIGATEDINLKEFLIDLIKE